MQIISGSTPTEAYLEALRTIVSSPNVVKSSPRAQPIREIINATVVMTKPDEAPIRTCDPNRNEIIARYTLKEFELYGRGETKAAEFEKAAKFWGSLANPDGTINSAYGWLIFHDKSCGNTEYEVRALDAAGHFKDHLDQGQNVPYFDPNEPGMMRTPWQWAFESLVKDRDTRQAMVKLHKREHLWMGNKDQVCTAYLIFHIRNDELMMTVHMRSQDLVLGAVYDWPYFSSLQLRMHRELSGTYPDLRVGRYTHVMDSMHVYERNVIAVINMIRA